MSSCKDERFRSELPLHGELLDYFESLGSDLDLDSLKVFLFLLFLPHCIHSILSYNLIKPLLLFFCQDQTRNKQSTQTQDVLDVGQRLMDEVSE